MNENELAHMIMDDDGAGSAITSIPAGQGSTWNESYEAWQAAGSPSHEYAGHPLPGVLSCWICAHHKDEHSEQVRELPDPVHHNDIFSRIEASTAGER
jgi:hypothetical protein